jgi:hypothetical protein
MYAVVCRDAAAVPPSLVANLNEANDLVARHINIVAVLTARLMAATDEYGSRVGEVEQLTAAIARLTSSQ